MIESRPHSDFISALEAMRELYRLGGYEQARAICESRFLDHPGLRDEIGHPIYYKEMFRICLALGRIDSAGDVARTLQPLLAPSDACIEVLYGRHFEHQNDLLASRRAWEAALERSPHPEALAWLAKHSKPGA